MTIHTADVEPAGLGLAEHVCLALVVDEVSHGWAIGSLLTPDGELGRIWSLSRPLTYRALDQLVDKGLIERSGPESGPGLTRRPVSATDEGRRTNRVWLDRPVDHIRDIRTELLLKLELRRRAGLPLDDLLDSQATALAPTLDSLAHVREPDLVEVWRRENARAVRRFLSAALAAQTGDAEEPTSGPSAGLQLSARNQLHATIDQLVFGDLSCSVRAILPDGQTLSATITRAAADDLDLAEGDDVIMITKATETMVARLR